MKFTENVNWLFSDYSMACGMPGFLIFHYLLEFAQNHVHYVNDAIKPSYALLPASLALSLSQHKGLFQQADSSHQVAKELKFQL